MRKVSGVDMFESVHSIFKYPDALTRRPAPQISERSRRMESQEWICAIDLEIATLALIRALLRGKSNRDTAPIRSKMTKSSSATMNEPKVLSSETRAMISTAQKRR